MIICYKFFLTNAKTISWMEFPVGRKVQSNYFQEHMLKHVDYQGIFHGGYNERFKSSFFQIMMENLLNLFISGLRVYI